MDEPDEQSYTDYDFVNRFVQMPKNRVKNITLVSSPETKEKWPTPPVYEPLWSFEKIRKCAFADVGDRVPANVIIARVISTMGSMRADYDQALSLAQFNLWQCQGMKE